MSNNVSVAVCPTNVSVSVIIPTWNSSGHLAATLHAVARLSEHFDALQIVIVDDFSSDASVAVAMCELSNIRYANVSYTLVELSRNVGQSSATAIGMMHSRCEFLVTLDDDLSYPTREIPNLIHALNDRLDFIMGAPICYPNSRLRGLASRIVRRLATKAFDTPHDFVFSSFVAYRNSFVKRVILEELPVENVGWMFRHTRRYANLPVSTDSGLRSQSNYEVRHLFRTAKPLMEPLALLAVRALRWMSAFVSIVAAVLSCAYLYSTIFGTGLLHGFPTIVILSLANLLIVGLALSIAINTRLELRRIRRSEVFKAQFRTLSKPK